MSDHDLHTELEDDDDDNGDPLGSGTGFPACPICGVVANDCPPCEHLLVDVDPSYWTVNGGFLFDEVETLFDALDAILPRCESLLVRGVPLPGYAELRSQYLANRRKRNREEWHDSLALQTVLELLESAGDVDEVEYSIEEGLGVFVYRAYYAENPREIYEHAIDAIRHAADPAAGNVSFRSWRAVGKAFGGVGSFPASAVPVLLNLAPASCTPETRAAVLTRLAVLTGKNRRD